MALDEESRDGCPDVRDLAERVTRLERIVTFGNGHPSLTNQVTELESNLNQLSNRVAEICKDMGKIDELKEGLVEIKTQLKLQDRGWRRWFEVALIVLTIIGTAVAERFG